MKKIFALLLAFIITCTAVPYASMAETFGEGSDDVYYEDSHPLASAGCDYLPNPDVAYAAKSVESYIANNPGELPKYVTVAGNMVHMPEFIGILAQFIIYTENEENVYVLRNSITDHSAEYERLTVGELTKTEYIALAYDTVAYINKKHEAPGYIKTELGELSFSTIIFTFSKVVVSFRNYGILPESVQINAWGSPLPLPPQESAEAFKTESVLNAANIVNTYIANNMIYPTYVTVDGEKVYMSEILGLFSSVIVQSDAGILEETVDRNDATYSENSYEAISGTIFNRAAYVSAAEKVVEYIENSPSASAPGYISTDIGTLSFETLIKTFSYICNVLKDGGALPESVIVQRWHSALPTPPQETEAPEYEYLNFAGVLKGARRVVDAIEQAGTIPNYVTLGTDIRILPGTMARLFAATVSNIYRNKAADMPLQEIATPKKIVGETLTAGTFQKNSYIKVAQRMASIIYENDAVPTYITTDLGTMNYCNVIYMFSRILEYYLTYGFLPDTIEVQPWGTYAF